MSTPLWQRITSTKGKISLINSWMDKKNIDAFRCFHVELWNVPFPAFWFVFHVFKILINICFWNKKWPERDKWWGALSPNTRKTRVFLCGGRWTSVAVVVVTPPYMLPLQPPSLLPPFPHCFCFKVLVQKNWLDHKQHAQFPQFPPETEVSLSVWRQSGRQLHEKQTLKPAALVCKEEYAGRRVGGYILIKWATHVWVRARRRWRHLCLCAKGGMVREWEGSGGGREEGRGGRSLPTPHAM